MQRGEYGRLGQSSKCAGVRLSQSHYPSTLFYIISTQVRSLSISCCLELGGSIERAIGCLDNEETPKRIGKVFFSVEDTISSPREGALSLFILISQ